MASVAGYGWPMEAFTSEPPRLKAGLDALDAGALYLYHAASEGRPLTRLELLRSLLACEAASETFHNSADNLGAKPEHLVS